VAAVINFAVVAIVVIAGISAAAGFAALQSIGAHCLVLLYVVTSAAIIVFFLKLREPGISKAKTFIAPTLATDCGWPMTAAKFTLLAFAGMGAVAYLSTDDPAHHRRGGGARVGGWVLDTKESPCGVRTNRQSAQRLVTPQPAADDLHRRYVIRSGPTAAHGNGGE
jgi:amino acid transporter